MGGAECRPPNGNSVVKLRNTAGGGVEDSLEPLEDGNQWTRLRGNNGGGRKR